MDSGIDHEKAEKMAHAVVVEADAILAALEVE